jgi:hypothetical protein
MTGGEGAVGGGFVVAAGVGRRYRAREKLAPQVAGDLGRWAGGWMRVFVAF